MFLPVLYGCVLTFLVALIRYVLATKAAKNIQARTRLPPMYVHHFESFSLISSEANPTIVGYNQGCQIFPVKTYQSGGKYPK
jgi:hypothetical protein